MQEQDTNRHSLVILPLLCSLVGAVAFICFGMSTINNAAANLQDSPELTAKRHRIQQNQAEIDSLQELLDDVLPVISALEEKLHEKEYIDIASAYNGNVGSYGSPQFVECIGDMIFLQPQNRAISSVELSDSRQEFLQSIKSTGYVVFCVRPSGFESFLKARSVAEETGTVIGYEPINEDWKLKF